MEGKASCTRETNLDGSFNDFNIIEKDYDLKFFYAAKYYDILSEGEETNKKLLRMSLLALLKRKIGKHYFH